MEYSVGITKVALQFLFCQDFYTWGTPFRGRMCPEDLHHIPVNRGPIDLFDATTFKNSIIQKDSGIFWWLISTALKSI